MSSICVINGVTYVNGKRIGADGKPVTSIECKSLKVKLDDVELSCEEAKSFIECIKSNKIAIGNGRFIDTTSTNIHVEGSGDSAMSTSGDISCNSVRNATSTSGDIKVGGKIIGNANTVSGDIRTRS